METSLNEIVENIMVDTLEYEITRLVTKEDVKKIVKEIIDREDFHDIVVEEIEYHTLNFK